MKAVLIGVGMVAETHVRAIAAAAPAVTLAGVCARDGAKAQTFARRMSLELDEAPKVYPTVASVMADDSVDFVIICTPPNARMSIVEACVKARKPILMEKPIERDSAAAAKIVAMCKVADLPLGIVLQHRVRESSVELMSLLKGGLLGPVAMAEVAVPWWRAQSYYDEAGRGTYARDGGGVLISQAIHTLDLMATLLGPVTRVQAMARTTALHEMEAEDFVTAGVEFASGAVGSVMASTASYPGGAESITLHCAKASVCLRSGQLRINWRDGRSEEIGEAGGTGGGANPMAFTHAWHQTIIEDFAAALRDGRPPIATGQDAMHVHHLIDAMITSSRDGRVVTVLEAA